MREQRGEILTQALGRRREFLSVAVEEGLGGVRARLRRRGNPDPNERALHLQPPLGGIFASTLRTLCTQQRIALAAPRPAGAAVPTDEGARVGRTATTAPAGVSPLRFTVSRIVGGLLGARAIGVTLALALFGHEHNIAQRFAIALAGLASGSWLLTVALRAGDGDATF